MKKIIRKTWVFTMIMGLLSLWSCDAHTDFPDLSIHTGHVLCSDGTVVPYEHLDSLGKTPVAVIYRLNPEAETPGQALAVYIKDLTPSEIADTLGTSQSTSCSLTAFDGNMNTYNLYTSKTGSPAATQVFDMWWYGQSAYIPSVREMRELYSVKETINAVLSLIGGDQLSDEPSRTWYWTSTEVQGQASEKAWLFSMASGVIQEAPKNQSYKIRPVVTVNAK